MESKRNGSGQERIKVKNDYVKGSLKVAHNKLTWYGHVLRRDEQNVVKKVLSMDVNGCKSRGRTA